MRIVEFFGLREGWDSNFDSVPHEGESATEYLKRLGIRPDQVQILHTSEVYHITTVDPETGRTRRSKQFGNLSVECILRPIVPKVFYGASEYDGQDEHGNPKNPLEDSTTPRVSFSRTLKGALFATNIPEKLPEKWPGEVWVYMPKTTSEFLQPSKEPLEQFSDRRSFDEKNLLSISDVDRSQEIWSIRQILCKRVMIVKPGENFIEKQKEMS